MDDSVIAEEAPPEVFFSNPALNAPSADGWVYVADRENNRIQVFDGNGRFETEIVDIHRPSALAISPGSCPLCFVGELGPYRGWPNLGPRVSIPPVRGSCYPNSVARGGRHRAWTVPVPARHRAELEG